MTNKRQITFFSLIFSPVFALFFMITNILLAFYIWFPSAKEVRGCITTSMYNLELCPSSKLYVPLNSISKYMQNALLVTEDSSFYQHNGFDQEGIQLCLQKMRTQGRIVCGGSTITQQLAKNLFLTKEKSFIRKGLEALITLQLESALTKREILERYLNVVQFGKNIFGIRQASQFYFKKTPSQLNVLESSFLAMVLPNPEKYAQSYYRKDLTRYARRRLSRIVNDLYRYKRISDNEYVSAMDSLDFFFTSAQTSERAQDKSEELSDDEFLELFDENR